ncbi:PREDICTED: uncharacterized protein LOC104715205 [Camelina sativa]|uniref:Uncharacterized protein LOC104715205 n=1 Tax=Camelina sativa TaxID=90675 RepID=A0ABM0TT52_CAMSA|nr:PREDICTED: uncharacterized protein LOC104715205 [Camelina sativa]
MAQPAEKAIGVTHIKSYIPLVFYMQKMNYDAWRELFETHCLSFSVSGHLDGTSVHATPQDTAWKERDGLVKMWIYGTISPSLLDTVLKSRCTARELWVTIENLFSVSGHLDGTSVPATPQDTAWKERDGLVKMWIYGTISPSLLDTVLKSRCTARELWVTIENLFHDNKEVRAIQLENELRSFTIGDLSVLDYCQKLKSISDLLANVDSPITERSLVIHMLNGLSEKFDNIHNVIKHKSPFPSFGAARSMLLLEEECLNKPSKLVTSAPLGTSTPHLLYTDAGSSTPQSHHATNNRNSSPQHFPPHTNRGHQNRGRGRGRNNGYRGRGRHNNHHNINNSWMPQQPSYWPVPPHQQPWIPQQWRPSPMVYHVTTTLPHNNGILGAYPSSVPTGPPMPTAIPPNIAQAFGTMSLQNPQDSNWYMDTGATAHITSEPGLEHTDSSSPM